MRLTRRFLLSLLACVGVVVVCALAAVGERARVAARADLRRRIDAATTLAARGWTPGADPRAVVDSLAGLLGWHVTLVSAPDGRVVADSRERDTAAAWIQRYGALPEVVAAAADAGRRTHAGTRGIDSLPEIAAAARGAAGVVRLAATYGEASALEVDVQRGVLLAGLVGALAALALTRTFVRDVGRPLGALRAATRALAAGDLHRAVPLDGTDEVVDIARAVHRLAEQAGGRVLARTVEADLLVALSESLTEGVVAVDARQTVVYANDTARTSLGLTQAIPFPADHLPRDRDLRDALRDALGGLSTGPVELRVGERVMALSARPIAGGAGAVLTFFDLTPMRRLEAIRRDFVANVSHELKTPLTVVGGFAETLATDDDLPASDRRRFAESIRANAHRMQRIVDDLLDLSRIESGGWRPRPSRLDVRDAAEEASAAAHDAAAARGVRFAIDVAPDAAEVWADATAVRQVVSNLVENAVRHTTQGEVAVVGRRDAARGGVWLGVRDTGCGISAQHLPRIFERFYRADPGRSREAGGTGLGLAIVKHLVEAHGGEVRAESAVGVGTWIEAFFPDARAAT